MSLPQLVLLEPQDFPPEALALLEKHATVRQAPNLSLQDALAAADAVWLRLGYRVEASSFPLQVRCKALVVPTTGLDHIDRAACGARGVEVLSLQGESIFLNDVRATAEHTLALTLALLRQLIPASASVRQGAWDRDAFRGHELYQKTVGIIGMGRLGVRVARMFDAMGARVLGYDHQPVEHADDVPVSRVEDLKVLLAHSDVVSLHASYEYGAPPIFGADQFSLMKRHSVLINTARGGLVDSAALVKAIKNEHLAGAALDVVAGEANVPCEDPAVVFSQHDPRILVTPHIGGNTYESLHKVETFMAKKLCAFLGVGCES